MKKTTPPQWQYRGSPYFTIVGQWGCYQFIDPSSFFDEGDHGVNFFPASLEFFAGCVEKIAGFSKKFPGHQGFWLPLESELKNLLSERSEFCQDGA